MTPIHRIEFPRIVLVGSNAINEIAEVANSISQGKTALIVAGKKTMKIAGEQVKDYLENAGFNVNSFFSEIADSKSIGSAQEIIKENKANLVLGVGGGTAIDIAKLSSAREKIPFISVPTAASHDGIASPIASIHDADKVKSYPTRAPVAIVADTKIIATSPHRMTASGCADLVSNYTAVEDWRLAHRLKGEYFGEYAAALAIMSAQVIMENASVLKENTESAVKIVVEGLVSSGAAMCIAGSSRPCSGAEHLFSHALDRIAKKPAMHGEQCGVGTIMMAYLHGLDWEKFRDSLKTIGAPTTAKELGIDDETIIKALTIAHTIRDRYTILGENGLTEEAAIKLAKATGVID